MQQRPQAGAQELRDHPGPVFAQQEIRQGLGMPWCSAHRVGDERAGRYRARVVAADVQKRREVAAKVVIPCWCQAGTESHEFSEGVPYPRRVEIETALS